MFQRAPNVVVLPVRDSTVCFARLTFLPASLLRVYCAATVHVAVWSIKDVREPVYLVHCFNNR